MHQPFQNDFFQAENANADDMLLEGNFMPHIYS